jgi:hypothetical protein
MEYHSSRHVSGEAAEGISPLRDGTVVEHPPAICYTHA